MSLMPEQNNPVSFNPDSFCPSLYSYFVFFLDYCPFIYLVQLKANFNRFPGIIAANITIITATGTVMKAMI